jgi:hypothetical protein
MKFMGTLPLLLLAAAVPAHSVTTQYPGGYITDFSGLANLSGCSGVLLADGIHVLTAAHCASSTWSVNSAGQTLLTQSIFGLSFFTGAYPGGISDAVTGVQFNPLTSAWFNTDPSYGLTYDIAILDLATPAPADATRYNLDLSGYAIDHNSPVVMEGWGLGGYPGGEIGGNGVYGTSGNRRAGTNTVAGIRTTINDPYLPSDPSVTLPDDPIRLLWTTTSDTTTPSDTLGLSNAGDSGGPLLYNGDLIGITSFGDVPRSGILPIGQTYEADYVNLANPGNADWLDSVLEGTPEPGTWMLAAGGALLVLLRRRAVRR